MKFTISPSRPEDLDALPGIEARAAHLFATAEATRALGLHLDTAPPRDFRPAHDAGLLWIARDEAGVPLGFALAEPLDGGWHLEEMDVDPTHARQGIGAALVRAICATSPARVTLTTFRDVPWNAPFYARLGFAPQDNARLSPALAHRMAEEEARGLPRALRVAMVWEPV